MNNPRARLREMLAKPGMIVAPFVFVRLQAKLAANAGFDAVYMTGFGTAAARGYPDLGLLTMTEMVANVRAISRAVNVPVICDADTGYGNPLNARRTVREYEDAGASALHIEDQVFPKRCGFFAGKQVVPLETMANKVRAACDARRDPNLVVIARTDALQVNGWDDVVSRARAYRASGADLIFADGIKTTEDLKRYAEKLGDLPLIYNGDLLPIDELRKYPFKITIHIGTMLAAFDSMRATMTELKRTGKLGVDTRSNVFAEIVRLMGVEEFEALEKSTPDRNMALSPPKWNPGAYTSLLDLDINWDLEEMLRPIGDAIRASIETIDAADKEEKPARIWIVDEECDSIESWLGLAFVAAQTYITRVISHCKRVHDWHERQTKSRVLLGTKGAKHEILAATTPKVRFTNYSAIEAVDSFANYFKHRDEWPLDWTQLQHDNEKRTAEVIKAFGARPGCTGNLRLGYASLLGERTAFNEVARLGGVVHDWVRSFKTAYEQELR